MRTCSVTGDCGPALSGSSIYVDEVGPGGERTTRIDASTDAKLYSSQIMPGFTSQMMLPLLTQLVLLIACAILDAVANRWNRLANSLDTPA